MGDPLSILFGIIRTVEQQRALKAAIDGAWWHGFAAGAGAVLGVVCIIGLAASVYRGIRRDGAPIKAGEIVEHR